MELVLVVMLKILFQSGKMVNEKLKKMKLFSLITMYYYIGGFHTNRYSFYFHGELETEHIGQSDSNLSKELLKKMYDYKIDMILETQFYLNVLELFCTHHNIKLIWTTTENYVQDNLQKENFSGIDFDEIEKFEFNGEDLYDRYHGFVKILMRRDMKL